MPVGEAVGNLASAEDLVSLYAKRITESGEADLAHLMLMTRWYQEQAFALAIEVMGAPAAITCVLDIGCGCGCFLPVLRASGFAGEYVGVDMVPGFVAIAQERFAGDGHASFILGDFLKLETVFSPDCCTAISIFGYACQADFMDLVLAKAAAIEARRVILTCNSAAHQVLPLKAKCYSPLAVLSSCLRVGKNVHLVHRCIPYEQGHYALVGASVELTPACASC